MARHQPPRDPKALLTEMDARIKVRDIREWEALKNTVSVKWWESLLLAVLFVSGAAIVITVSQLISDRNSMLYGFIMTWSVLFVLTLIACIEFLIVKFRALRRMHEVTTRKLREHDAALKAIRDYLEAAEDARRGE